MEKTKLKRNYVSPFVEELDLEPDVRLLTISQNTKTTLKSMEIDNTFDSGSSSSAPEIGGHDYVFDENE